MCSLTIECVLQGDVQVREKVECLDAAWHASTDKVL